MPKPVTTNEHIARGIIEVLKKEHISIEELKRKVPKRFWDKVRDAMGEQSPDKGTISARWNRPSSGPQIRGLVELWLSNPACLNTDVACDHHVIEPYADIEVDPPDYLDPSLVVDLDADALVSMGVKTETIGDLDTCDLDSGDSVDMYGRDGASLVDTIDIETETWPAGSSLISDDPIFAVHELQNRLTERLEDLARGLENKLTLRLQTLVQDAVEKNRERGVIDPSRTSREACPVSPRARGQVAGKKVSIRVMIDANLFELFDAECRLRFHGNATQAMNEILWRHYQKPRLSFEHVSEDPD
jgi:hypothetical protein